MSQGAPRGLHFRLKSARRQTTRLAIDSLESLVVLHLINAKTEDLKKSFLSRFGMLIADWEMNPEELERRRREAMSALRELTGTSPPRARGRAEELVNQNLAKINLTSRMIFSPESGARIVLQPRSLWQFLYLEIALAAAHGTHLHFCKQCDDAFLTGPLTGRRGQSVFCSDKCRVASFRAAKRV